MVTTSLILFITFFYSFGDSKTTINQQPFPHDFKFGTASSSYQIEGAWDEDGKTENIWDYLTHNYPERIKDGSNGDIACDSYHKTEEDVLLLKELGVQYYRFSLSWTRILPWGFSNKINQAGIDYYNELIDTLLAHNITPFITLYHWEFPQSLQVLGGFTNPLVVEWFQHFAKVAFDHFGDRVKLWSTFNEPRQICLFGYGSGTLAPGYSSSGIADYICSHHLLLAHAAVYHMYDKMYRPTQKGNIGIVIDCSWNEPASNSSDDIAAAQRKIDFECGWYAHPIFSKSGNYPPVMKEFVSRRSKLEGFRKSRLPEFTLEEIEYLRGTSDYFGLNHYSTFLVADKAADVPEDPAYLKDTRLSYFQDPSWPAGSISHFRSVPWGFNKILNWIKNHYGDPEIYVAENGFPDPKQFQDRGRIEYLIEYLSNLLDAIYNDGVNVKMYFAWTFMDNFEWFKGYTARFGLYHVNFTDPNRPRIAKDSAKVYRDIIKNRKLPDY